MKTHAHFQFWAIAYLLAICMPNVHARTTYGGYNASSLLEEILDAMRARTSIGEIEAFTFESASIFRSQTLTQSYNIRVTDQSVAAAGSQTLSFRVDNGTLRARFDRSYRYNDYWTWAHPDLQPDIGYSVVIKDGAKGFACFNKGQNSFFVDDPKAALGYVDGFLADYLVHEAHQYALPWLLQRFSADFTQLRVASVNDNVTNVPLIAIEHPDLGLSLVLNTTSKLPRMVRSVEEDPIYGPTTIDMILTNYTQVSLVGSNASIILPHRVQTVHNSTNTIEDFIVDQIMLNPHLPDDLFEPTPNTTGQTPRSAPAQSAEYPRGEVHAFYEAGLWGGPFGEQFNVSSVTVEHPMANNKAVKSVYVGYPDYVQLLVEIGDDLIVTDAAPHRSVILIDWVKKNMGGKRITYVVPSHHHRDHAGGIADYAAAGAKVVIPEVATTFYQHANNGDIQMVTYNATHPFMLADEHLQFRSFWRDENPHARDWTYALVTERCPSSESPAVVFNADVVSPGFDTNAPLSDALRWDTAYARQWLIAAAEDGVPLNTTIIGAHGSTNANQLANAASLQHVIDLTGFDYPHVDAARLQSPEFCSD